MTLLISDLAAVPMQEVGMPLLDGLIPILVLVAMELLFSGLMLKVPFFYRLISGRPMVVINNGKLDQQALRRMRVTIGDMMETLRGQNVFDIEQIQYAIAETNGQISVLLKPEYRPPSCGDLNAVRRIPGGHDRHRRRTDIEWALSCAAGPPMAGKGPQIPALSAGRGVSHDRRPF